MTNLKQKTDCRGKLIYSQSTRHLSQLLIFVIFILALCLAGCKFQSNSERHLGSDTLKFYPLEEMAIEAEKAAQPETDTLMKTKTLNK